MTGTPTAVRGSSPARWTVARIAAPSATTSPAGASHGRGDASGAGSPRCRPIQAATRRPAPRSGAGGGRAAAMAACRSASPAAPAAAKASRWAWTCGPATTGTPAATASWGACPPMAGSKVPPMTAYRAPT
ncbi:MAG: hypothetical protein R3F59_25915 [Myxococcota bacterium]